jgi:hypothetical protein
MSSNGNDRVDRLGEQLGLLSERVATIEFALGLEREPPLRRPRNLRLPIRLARSPPAFHPRLNQLVPGPPAARRGSSISRSSSGAGCWR